jgi:hypothetical protein
MSIVLLGSTSGSITLQEPAVAGTTVLDLPATSGTLALTSSVVSSLNGSTGALKGMTLISTTNVSAATTIDITNIPTTAGATYILQMQGRMAGTAGVNIFSLRYSTNNGSTFATTAISSAGTGYNDSNSTPTYMSDVIRTTNNSPNNIFSVVNLSNGGTVNTASVYPTANSQIQFGDYENGTSILYSGYRSAPDDTLDSTGAMVSGAGTVRGATFNALRIIRRQGSQTFTGSVKLFLLGV